MLQTREVRTDTLLVLGLGLALAPFAVTYAVLIAPQIRVATSEAPQNGGGDRKTGCQ